MLNTPLMDHAGIAARVPHAGAMCLLDAVLACTGDTIECRIVNQADPHHPLRTASGLLAPAGIEYAAQAMALHGSMSSAAGQPPVPGFLASARSVTLHHVRLDTQPGPLSVTATRVAGNGGQALYRFELRDATGQLLVDGRAAVVLDTPLDAKAIDS